jgi:ABC-type nickel/cobalt efflux system permease component RcnA
MEPVFAVVASGLIAGVIHVVSGVDHLAALMPLSVGKRWSAVFLGLRWGIGHTAGVIVVALLAVALKQQLDIASVLGVWAESLVGVMLIAIGLYGIRRGMKYEIHEHQHEHDGDNHMHAHTHRKGGAVHAEGESGAQAGEGHHLSHEHAAFMAGILHGVAGTSHFLGVLPAVALPTWLLSGTYLAGYGAGSIVAMGAFAAMIGAATSRRGVDTPRFVRNALYVTSAIAIAVGVAWLVMPALA